MLHFTYKTVNIINGKFYIGKHSTSNIEDGYLGSGLVLNYDIGKYGKENFIMCDLEFCDSEDEAYFLERILLDEVWNHPLCYNICGGGRSAGSGEKHPQWGKSLSEETKRKLREANSGENNPNWGKSPSKETRKKLSEAGKGRICLEETRKKLSKAFKGRKISEEQKRKLSEAHKGKILSEEHRKKISEAMTGENNPNYGKKHSEEAKKKISKANSGRIPSEETRRKISEAVKGKKRSKEQREKYSEAFKGRICSEETKRKLREINLGKKHSKESRKKMSESTSGEKHPQWGKSLSEETKRKLRETNSKIVYQYNKETGVFIQKFYSCTEAEKSISENWGNTFSLISKCASGKQKSSCGFIWSYTKQENIF